nr:hypothetical protein [uncultured Campylobacter sp.]
MGYDVSYHPINENEIKQWYFDALKSAREGDWSFAKMLAKEHGMEDFYAQKYIDTLKIALETNDDESFSTGHGYILAAVQGFYTRGTAFGFLAQEHGEFKRYLSDISGVIPPEIKAKFTGEFDGNYSSGAFISAANLAKFWQDYNAGGEIKRETDEFYAQNLPAFLSAVKFGVENGYGVLEATDVIIPNPIDLNDSECYSNLFNCDPEGAFIYADTAAKQLSEAMKLDKKDESDKNEDSGGFLGAIKRLFGK